MLRILIAILCLGPMFTAVAEENNVIIATENGLDMFAWDLEFIRHANQSVEVAACFCGGKILRELLTALDKRLDEVPALQVYILGSPILMEEPDKAMLDTLRSKHQGRFRFQITSNVLVLLPDYSTIDNHVKCLIVDEKYFSMGGTNLDEVLCSDGTYTPPRNSKGGVTGSNLPAGVRDQDLVGRGPIARDLRHLFFKCFAMWEDFEQKGMKNFEKNLEVFHDANRYTPIDTTLQPFVEAFETSERCIETSNIQLIYSGPMQSQNKITAAYLDLLRSAKNEIVIGNLYFNPADSIISECMNVVNRNVDVTLITNGIGGNSPSYTDLFCWAHRMNYVPLFYGRTFHFWDAWWVASEPVKKVKIFEYDVKDILYHKKVMVVDRRYTIIGSYNLGIRSDMSDYELVFLIDSEEVAETALKVLRRDLILSREVSPELARSWYFDPVTAYIAGTQRQFHGLI